ncbi:MAG: NAD(P)H-hydrate dehydratase [Chitinophagales bacterium]|nr:NAD(P)H-hydrate dehydratase [Chitinophagales bacterium]
MKILSAQQIRQLDKYTIAKERIASINLMERAAAKFTDQLISFVNSDSDISIFCGLGNNGGDGLAVARQLLARGYTNISVFVVMHGKNKSPDFEINESRLKESLPITYISNSKQIPRLKTGTVIIDALFGSGLNRRVEGIAAEVISAINKSKAKVISIDVPSGLFCDKLNDPNDTIVKSTLTLTFHAPKFSFLLAANGKYVPKFRVLDIGLSKANADKMDSTNYLIDDNFIYGLLKPRSKFSHKGTYGHALIIAGGYGKIGAAVLSVKAALRSGAGLVTSVLPQCGYEIMQLSNPEAMVVTSGENELGEILGLDKFSAIGIGPGIGTEKDVVGFFQNLLKASRAPMVLDADALNILSEYKSLLKLLPGNSILTPHPGEFKRLVGDWIDDMEKLKKQVAFSKKYKVVVVLKGANTSVSSATGQLYFNSTGNAGMAKGGSGDVLTGIITSLLAQKYTPLHAALLGVYVHGLAGDLAREEFGYTAMNASDIIAALPAAFKQLETETDFSA